MRLRGTLFLLLMTAFVIVAFVLDVGENGAMARGKGGGCGGCGNGARSSSGVYTPYRTTGGSGWQGRRQSGGPRGRRSPGGSRSSSRSSSGGSRSSSSGLRSSSRSSSSGSSGWRSSTKGAKLVRNAVNGRGVYSAAKKQKLRRNWKPIFAVVSRGRTSGYDFEDWNEWREDDGLLCRDMADCNWIGSDIVCKSYELDFAPSASWFGGDAERIMGQCACRWGMSFDGQDLECKFN